MMRLELILPWPQRVLWPNSRPHNFQLARAKKEFREECAWEAKRKGATPLQAQALHASLVFFPPTRRRYDLDNALAAMKSGIDGLANVLQVDDSLWSFQIAKAPQGEVGGWVKVCITTKDSDAFRNE